MGTDCKLYVISEVHEPITDKGHANNEVKTDIQDLFEHFKSLSGNSESAADELDDKTNGLHTNEEKFDTSDMNKPFTEERIRKTIKKLKYNSHQV